MPGYSGAKGDFIRWLESVKLLQIPEPEVASDMPCAGPKPGLKILKVKISLFIRIKDQHFCLTVMSTDLI